jgi:hypothetical protein
MALDTAIEGSRHTPQTITFARADEATQNLTGATLTGTIKNIRTGVERAITGTLALGTAASGIFTWAYSAGDLVAGDYQVQFVATYGDATIDRSAWVDWTVQPAAASTSTQPRATMLARDRAVNAGNISCRSRQPPAGSRSLRPNSSTSTCGGGSACT